MDLRLGGLVTNNCPTSLYTVCVCAPAPASLPLYCYTSLSTFLYTVYIFFYIQNRHLFLLWRGWVSGAVSHGRFSPRQIGPKGVGRRIHRPHMNWSRRGSPKIEKPEPPFWSQTLGWWSSLVSIRSQLKRTTWSFTGSDRHWDQVHSHA